MKWIAQLNKINHHNAQQKSISIVLVDADMPTAFSLESGNRIITEYGTT
jgi:hypothetical protein